MTSRIGNSLPVRIPFFRPELKRKKRGMTLLEVLVSVVILGTALIAIYRPLLSSLSALNFVDSRLEAIHLMNVKIWEFRQKVKILGKFPREGIREELIGRQKVYAFRLDAGGKSEPGGLVPVRCEISWEVGRQQKNICRTFYLLMAKEDNKP